eukprot:TRINITY_DN3996_c0_g1_i1.p1 TRINITY_DN3996_c0_g1~~TRINITY_DN3996_c0_g1_i1.p1  ORF type:complete len:586 (+),score=194.03 TRINITY_DN3996_c0_g1_i1:80-1837(+)
MELRRSLLHGAAGSLLRPAAARAPPRRLHSSAAAAAAAQPDPFRAENIVLADRGAGGSQRTDILPQLRLVERMPLKDAVEYRRQAAQDLGESHPQMRLVDSAVEQAALANREWSDQLFQWGKEENERVLAEVEAEYREMAARSEGGLENDPALLSAGIDLAVCYVKNVKLSMADAQYAKVVPHARKRGGVWKVKALNHLVTLRMKQGRHVEAYALLKEIESGVTATHDEAREAWTTLYRNQAMGLLGLSDFSGALMMYIKAAQVSGKVTWWDRWDIGFSMSLLAFDRKDPTMLRRAAVAIQDAIPLHLADEPEDRVMHSKIYHALGDAYMLLAQLDPLGQAKGTAAAPAAGAASAEEVEKATEMVVQPGRMVPLLSAKEYYALAAEQFITCNDAMKAASGKPGDLSAGAAGSIAFCLLPLGRYEEAAPHVQHVLLHHCTASNGHRACHFLARALDHSLECRSHCGQSVFREVLPQLYDLMHRLDGDPLDMAVCRFRCALLLTSAGDDENVRKGVGCMRMAEPELRRRTNLPNGINAGVMDAILKLAKEQPAPATAPGREEKRPLPPQRARGNDTWQKFFGDLRGM